jgi:hypothetical protein
MTLPDLINGIFECSGGFFIALSIRRLHRDKKVRGVAWQPVAFFTTWGLWNLYFYPALDQWLSFAGGVLLVATNAVWLLQMLYYLRQEKAQDKIWRDLIDADSAKRIV